MEKHFDIYVNGSQQPRKYAWGFVVNEGPVMLHMTSGEGKNPQALAMKNGGGEIEAVIRALKWAKKQQNTTVTIHYDYEGIRAWAKGEWPPENEFVQQYVDFLEDKLAWIDFVKKDVKR
ncbi:hypothetical protein [Azotosporobacter soli]|uniref:hypothetical protein n=1 Tax=Azotosporobacter soli TaxID=3055040 RepID=UPI0031FEC6CF